MSVDYYGCDCCGESRYSEYTAHCSKCDNRLCVWCLVNDDIDSEYAYHYYLKFDGSQGQKEEFGVQTKEEDLEWGLEVGDVIDDVGIDSKYCPFCSGDKYTTDMLLEFALDKFEYSRSELIHDYRASRKGDKN